MQGILLWAGAVSFLVVNVCYVLINWSDIGPVKQIVHALGPAILVVDIVFSITGSLLTLVGTIVLVRQLLSVA